MQIQDKRVVVTGAASGIGKALCEAFIYCDSIQSLTVFDCAKSGEEKYSTPINSIVNFFILILIN